MLMYLDENLTKEFINNFVVRALMLKIETSCIDATTTKMDKFLKDTYGIDVQTIVDNIKIKVSKGNGHWIVGIDTNNVEKKSQEKVISLVKLIEYGNLEIRGLHVIDDAFRYIKEHLYALYKLYMMKGGRGDEA